MNAAQQSELESTCRQVEMRRCIVKALAEHQGLDIDVDEEFTYVEMSETVELLDEDADIAVNALVNAGYLTL
jgi:hypothetical protein